jgi:hypothetical protein
MTIADGIYEEVIDDSYTISTALVAAAAPLYPPSDWYENPEFSRPTPLTITPEGQIKGHIAAWDTSHIGLPPGTKPPHSASDYAFFKTGIVKTEDGKEYPVGQLTLAGGHAPLNASANEAVAHYDDTESAVADLTCGEDAHGIWVSGGLRPGVSDEQIRALRASAPSGDWRPINGRLELVAVCQVNTPGFPVARAMVASGEITALVAAGAGRMFELQQEASVLSALDSVLDRITKLEVIVAGAAKNKQSDFPDNPTTDSVELHDKGTGDLATGGESINAGIDKHDSSISEITELEIEPDDVPVDSDPVMEVVAREGTNTPTATQKHDAAEFTGGGADGGGDEADASEGLKQQEAARRKAEDHALEINGAAKKKAARLRKRFEKNC